MVIINASQFSGLDPADTATYASWMYVTACGF